MVLSYLIHTLHPSQPDVLYSQHFGGQQCQSNGTDVRDQSARQLAMCQRVCREYQFAYQVTAGGRLSVEDDLDRLRHDGIMPVFPTGVFALSSEKELPLGVDNNTAGRTVVWCGAATVAFVLIIGPSENRGLARAALALSIRLLQHYIQAVTSAKEILIRCDLTMHVIEHVFPLGQLVFRNARMVNQLEKELDQAIMKIRQH